MVLTLASNMFICFNALMLANRSLLQEKEGGERKKEIERTEREREWGDRERNTHIFDWFKVIKLLQETFLCVFQYIVSTCG